LKIESDERRSGCKHTPLIPGCGRRPSNPYSAHSRASGNPGFRVLSLLSWMPACAGMSGCGAPHAAPSCAGNRIRPKAGPVVNLTRASMMRRSAKQPYGRLCLWRCLMACRIIGVRSTPFFERLCPAMTTERFVQELDSRLRGNERSMCARPPPPARGHAPAGIQGLGFQVCCPGSLPSAFALRASAYALRATADSNPAKLTQ
jgi:hypothetical protein